MELLYLSNLSAQNRISALMLSAKEGSCEIVDILLHHQARPNAVDEVYIILVLCGKTNFIFANE